MFWWGLVGSGHGIEHAFDRYAAGRRDASSRRTWIVWAGLRSADHARELRRLIDIVEDIWLQELADVDRRGIAGADRGEVAPSTADWLSARLDVSSATANSWVRIARARYPGP